MRWLKRPASDTQITHRDRLWLYGVATVIMLLLVIPAANVDGTLEQLRPFLLPGAV